MADYGRVSWVGVEVVMSAEASRGRVSLVGAEVPQSSTASRARVSWLGVEVILSNAPDPYGRLAWVGVEVIMSAPESLVRGRLQGVTPLAGHQPQGQEIGHLPGQR